MSKYYNIHEYNDHSKGFMDVATIGRALWSTATSVTQSWRPYKSQPSGPFSLTSTACSFNPAQNFNKIAKEDVQ